MKRIRCVPLLCSSTVLPAQLVDAVVRRHCLQPLIAAGASWTAPARRQWKNETVPRILALAAGAARAALERRAAPVAPPAEVVARILDGLPDAAVLLDTVLAILSPNLLQSILEECDRRIDGRRTEIPRRELKLALVAFTEVCSPVNFQARECWCGSWIIEGEVECRFCKEPVPEKKGTTVWKKEYFSESQLEAMIEEHPEVEQELKALAESGVRIPKYMDPYEYMVAVEGGEFSGEEI